MPPSTRAPACVVVSVSRDRGWLHLEVSDDGCGFDAAGHLEAPCNGHIGLASVEHRVRALGGSMEIVAGPETGTDVSVRLPVGGGRSPDRAAAAASTAGRPTSEQAGPSDRRVRLLRSGGRRTVPRSGRSDVVGPAPGVVGSEYGPSVPSGPGPPREESLMRTTATSRGASTTRGRRVRRPTRSGRRPGGSAARVLRRGGFRWSRDLERDGCARGQRHGPAELQRRRLVSSASPTSRLATTALAPVASARDGAPASPIPAGISPAMRTTTRHGTGRRQPRPRQLHRGPRRPRTPSSRSTTSCRVTHEFAPSPGTPNLYEIKVTLENIGAATLPDVRYTRLMDWDVEPTAFEEFVTIQRRRSAARLR